MNLNGFFFFLSLLILQLFYFFAATPFCNDSSPNQNEIISSDCVFMFFFFFLATSNEAKYLLLKKKKPWSICYRKDSERSDGEYYLPDICSSSLSPLHTEQIKEGIKPSVSGDAAAAGPKINYVNSPHHISSLSPPLPSRIFKEGRRRTRKQAWGPG